MTPGTTPPRTRGGLDRVGVLTAAVALADAEGLSVKTYGNTVLLSGAVSSLDERDAAVAAAWAAPGVAAVKDQIMVEY